jgi:hypothetical protein
MAQLETLNRLVTALSNQLLDFGFSTEVEIEDNGKQSYSLVILKAKKDGIEKSYTFLTDSVKTIKRNHYSGKTFSEMIGGFRADIESQFNFIIQTSILRK